MCAKIRYVDKITGETIDSPADSTTAKAAGNPEIPSLLAKGVEEDSQTEEDLDNG